MELIHIVGNTYYINNVNKIGVYVVGSDAYLIDSGNDKEAAKKILRLLDEANLTLKGIIITHSNADHSGGAKYLSEKTNATIYASDIEEVIIKYPFLESALLYGGMPFRDLENKFLMAEPASAKNISNLDLFEVISLKGHYLNMIGIKTNDNVYFLGDSLFSEHIINKYHIFYIYDVLEFLKTLDYLETLNGYFVLSHADFSTDIKELIRVNRKKVNEIINLILNELNTKMTFEKLMRNVLSHYGLTLNPNQYVLVGSTLRSYITYLINSNQITFSFEDNMMYLRRI